MKFSLLERLKKSGERPVQEQAGPDLSRLKLAPAEKRPSVVALEPDMVKWLERDLEALTQSWSQFADDPSRQHWEAFSKAAHNLHGASGAYGGGALTRMTENLQRLLENQVSAMEHKALVNLHVQACKAWAIGNDEARTTLASAVCDALEVQVRRVL